MIKLPSALSGKAVVIDDVFIVGLEIPNKFINAILSPNSLKKFLSEDDIAIILCDIIAVRADRIVSLEEAETKIRSGNIRTYSERFEFIAQNGTIDFEICVKNGILKVLAVEFYLTKRIE